MDLDPLPHPKDANIGAGQVPSGPGESSQARVPYFWSTFVEDIDDDSDSEHEDSDEIS